MLNRLANAGNPYQGDAKKVLCVCSAGLLRSPSAAWVLSQEPFNFNTRAAGISTEYALIPVDKVLVHWADEIVCMEAAHARHIEKAFEKELEGKKLVVLAVPDRYKRLDPELIQIIKTQYEETTK